MDSTVRVGLGFDVHRLEPELPLWICGVRVESAVGARGHSDADVALHAVIDAILGALSLGDIGMLYPDNDPAYKNIASGVLVQRTLDTVRAQCAGWHVGNVDVTIALQRPKIGVYREKMVTTLAHLLECEASQVSVKATTTERLGFVGEGAGIAAWAVVTMVK